MSDIPSDIMDKAGDAILEGGKAYMVGEEFHIAISKAIYEERKRCARIADSWVTDLDEDVEVGDEYWVSHMNVTSCAASISKAILSGETKD